MTTYDLVRDVPKVVFIDSAWVSGSQPELFVYILKRSHAEAAYTTD